MEYLDDENLINVNRKEIYMSITISQEPTEKVDILLDGGKFIPPQKNQNQQSLSPTNVGLNTIKKVIDAVSIVPTLPGAVLASVTKFKDTIEIAKNFKFYGPNGRLESFYLTADGQIGPHSFPKATNIYIDSEGILRY